MDITTSNTEPFYKYIQTRAQISRSLMVAYSAIEKIDLSSITPDKTEIDLILPTGEEPWGKDGKMVWRNRAALKYAKTFITRMSLVSVISAYEDLLNGVQTDYDRYLHFQGKELTRQGKADDEALSTETLLKRLNWPKEPIAHLLPVLKYFTTVRNCIVHRSSLPNKTLLEISEDKDFSSIMSKLKSQNGKPHPPLPQIVRLQEIPLLPRHSVLANLICLEIAIYLNRCLLDFLGVQGFSYLAADHWILGDQPIPSTANSLEKILGAAFHGRYRVKDFKFSELIEILKEMNKWIPCVRRYETLYGDRPKKVRIRFDIRKHNRNKKKPTRKEKRS